MELGRTPPSPPTAPPHLELRVVQAGVGGQHPQLPRQQHQQQQRRQRQCIVVVDLKEWGEEGQQGKERLSGLRRGYPAVLRPSPPPSHTMESSLSCRLSCCCLDARLMTAERYREYAAVKQQLASCAMRDGVVARLTKIVLGGNRTPVCSDPTTLCEDGRELCYHYTTSTRT